MSYSHLPILMTVVPIAFAAVISVLWFRWKRAGFPLALMALAFSSVAAIFLARAVVLNGAISYHVAGWVPPWGIEIFVDYLGVLMALVIALVSMMAVFFSKNYAEKRLDLKKVSFYYALVLLLFSGMIGFVFSGDIYNMFIFFEIISLSSYSLVAILGDGNSLRAGFRYLVMGTVSSLFILMGIAFLYALTGTLNAAQVAASLSRLPHLEAVYAALILILIAFSIEAALFPLHVWLPQAHAMAPSPVSALLSGLVIGVGAFGMVKVLFYILPGVSSPELTKLFQGLAAAGIILGAIFALYEKDLKMLLAQSSISQIGYAVVGIFMFSYSGLVGSVLQILNHAFAKSALFLCAGAIIYRTGIKSLDDMKGIGRKMPITMGFFLIGLASIASIPLTCGFVSKYFLCLAAIEGELWWLGGVILLGAFLSILYCVRIVDYIFFGKPESKVEVKEAPLSMLIPLGVLTLFTVLIGVFPKTTFILIEPAVRGLLKLMG